MRRRIAAVAIGVVLATTAGATTFAADDQPLVGLPPHVVSSHVQYPKRVRLVLDDRFVPWVRPGPDKVRRIAVIEAKRWGASEGRLMCRISGESGFDWRSTSPSGAHHGVGQFLPSTFRTGMTTIQTYKV